MFGQKMINRLLYLEVALLDVYGLLVEHIHDDTCLSLVQALVTIILVLEASFLESDRHPQLLLLCGRGSSLSSRWLTLYRAVPIVCRSCRYQVPLHSARVISIIIP